MELSSEGSYAGINRFVKLLRHQQVDEDMDCLVGVSGLKGIGKSTFSGQVCRRYVPKYLKKKFIWEKYTPYTIEQVFDKLDTLPDYSPLNGDEVVNFALGEDWMRRKQKNLKKIFAKVRTKHHIFFFNILDIWWLDKKYRENMMTIWVHIVKKSHAMLALPNIAPGIEDRWYRGWLEKQFTKNIVTVFTPLNDTMKKLRKYPCYFDEFAFPKLPEPLYQKHLKLREKYILMRDEYEENFREKLITYLYWKFVNENNGQQISEREFVNKYLWNPLTDKPMFSDTTWHNMKKVVEDALNNA